MNLAQPRPSDGEPKPASGPPPATDQPRPPTASPGGVSPPGRTTRPGSQPGLPPDNAAAPSGRGASAGMQPGLHTRDAVAATRRGMSPGDPQTMLLRAVFSPRPRATSARWLALLAALGLHGLLALALTRLPARPAPPPQIQETMVMLEPPPPPPPPEPEPQKPEPQKPEPPAPKPKAKARAPRPAPRQVAKPPPPRGPTSPAQAGRLLTADADAPVDLTGEAFVSGQAAAFAGGATAPSGKSARYVAPGTAALKAPVRRRPTRARPVRLNPAAWRCAWPKAAMRADLYEQAVLLQVVVGPSGRVEQARVLDDPGHGFGDTARRCALRTRFQPARDPNGRPIRAQSPPLRVRFTR